MTTLQDAMQYIDHIHHAFRRRDLFQWGVADAETDAVIGTCTLTHFSDMHQRCEIGFALRQTHWGKGLGGEVLAAMIDFVFTTLDLYRIEADVDPRNARSLKLLERYGFEREGCLRERYLLHGERQDAVMLGLLRPNWRPATSD